MKFSDRMSLAGRTLIQSVRFAFEGEKATPFIFPSWGMGSMGVPSLIDYQTYADEGYGKNAVVHACVREISRSAPSARLQVRRKLKNAQTEVWEEHPLQALLNRPNQHQSQTVFVELYYTYLNIDGNAFIIREKKGRRTTALWLPRPDRMRPVIQGRDLVGYVYVTDAGEEIPWLPEEVIHVKEPNPGDPYEGLGRGLSPLASAAAETDVDNMATKFSNRFFANAGVPFGLLKLKNQTDDAEIKRIRRRMDLQYTGEQNWFKMMILDADAEYQQMAMSMQDMAFPDLRAISETRICAAFKVPPILIGIKAGLDASTYSNYTQARRAMWEDKIIPDNRKLADELSADFADELGPDGVVTHDYSEVVALQEDRNNRFSRANQGVNGGWITVNEARREVGLGPVKSGDVFLRPLMSQAAPGGADAQGMSGPVKEVKALPEKDVKEISWEERGALIHKRRDRVSRAWELRFLNEAKEEFKRESREIEALLRAQKGYKAAVLWGEIERILLGFIEQNAAAWALAFKPLLQGLLTDQGEEWADELGVDWNFQNPEVIAFLERYALKFADGVGATTKEALRTLLVQAQEEQWQMTQLIRGVGSLYDGWRDFQRAEMIARSETIRASNAGAMEAYRLAGITRKQWYAAEDERTCEFCGAMHGKIIETEQVFWNYGDEMTVTGEDGGVRSLVMSYEDVRHPPLHPDCRCTVLPVVE